MTSSRSPSQVAYLLLIAILGLLFWPLLIGTHSLAFRDAAHFYTPLYDYVAAQQQQQWIPLWNSRDLTGMPLLGESSTAVLYPPRWLIYQMIPSATTALSWYVVLHLLFAGCSAHYLAATAKLPPLGQALAIIAYPLAGPVVFLIYNPPFLVSAAWLPVLLATQLKTTPTQAATPTVRKIAWGAVATAMMIAAGDPQTAINAWLLITVYHLVGWTMQWWNRKCRAPHESSLLLGVTHALCSLTLGLCLIAPQLAASVDWTRLSNRMNLSRAESLSYHVKLWHWLEFASPFVSGQIFPSHTRISQVVYPGERDWTVTLYAGVAVAVLALTSLRQLNQPAVRHWILLASAGLLLAHPSVNHLLVQSLPGFQLFRYPAKWLPFASLGLVMLAAQSVQWFWTWSRIPRTSLWLLAVFSLLATLAAFFVLLPSDSWSPPTSQVWGPFDPAAARELIGLSLCHVLFFITMLAVCWRKELTISFLAILAIDLGLAAVRQRSMVRNDEVAAVEPQSDQSRILKTPVVAPEGIHRHIRSLTSHATPLQWRSLASPNTRVLENYVSEKGSMQGRWHLMTRQSLFNAPVTIRPQLIDQFWNAAFEIQASLPRSERAAAWLAIYRWLEVDQEWIVAPFMPSQFGENRQSFMYVAKTKSLPTSGSLAVWTPRWRPKALSSLEAQADMKRRLQELVIATPDSDQPLVDLAGELSTIPLQEITASPIPNSILDELSREQAEEIRVLTKSPEHLTVLLRTNRPGWLTMKMFQDGNWFATVRPWPKDTATSHQLPSVGIPTTLYRTDFLFMGTEIDAGQWQVDFIYRPWWLVPSILVTLAGWLIWSCLLVYSWFIAKAS